MPRPRKTTKCHSCGSKIHFDRDDSRTDLKGNEWCYPCYESATQYPSTYFVFGPDIEEPEVSYFTGEFGDFETGELPDPILEEVWVKTDPWRGYTDWKLNPDYIELAEGWVTGWPDQYTRRKAELGEYFEELRSGELKPPCNLYWVFGVTSNVFSTASTIFCKKSDVETLNKWFLEINDGIEHFQEMLS